MNLNEAIEKLSGLVSKFNADTTTEPTTEQTFIDAKLMDGTIIRYESLEVGMPLMVIDAFFGGTHTLAPRPPPYGPPASAGPNRKPKETRHERPFHPHRPSPGRCPVISLRPAHERGHDRDRNPARGSGSHRPGAAVE